MKYVYIVDQYYSGWLPESRVYSSYGKAFAAIEKEEYKHSFRVVKQCLNSGERTIVWSGSD